LVTSVNRLWNRYRPLDCFREFHQGNRNANNHAAPLRGSQSVPEGDHDQGCIAVALAPLPRLLDELFRLRPVSGIRRYEALRLAGELELTVFVTWPDEAYLRKYWRTPHDVIGVTGIVGEQHVNVGVAVDYAAPARPGHTRLGKP
jgi:hypothetical protein